MLLDVMLKFWSDEVFIMSIKDGNERIIVTFTKEEKEKTT